MTVIRLCDVVEVRGRFHRSVQLARDWHDVHSISEYLLTPTARDLATQILGGIQAPKGERAWSVTGPYGTGKSAFALFLADLLAHKNPTHAEARSLRQQMNFSLRPFVPVLIVGQRAPFTPTFLAALSESVKPIDSAIARKINRALQRHDLTDDDVLSLVDQSTQAVKKTRHGGMLVVVDEFGKFLEYAALHPETEDLLIIQHLAETAARSQVPMVIVTILHTAFAEYLNAADEAQRVEWQKVQGRFADVGFQEPPEQLIRLIGAAIRQAMPHSLESAYSRPTRQIIQSAALKEPRQRLPLQALLPSCVPLHPVTALLLWPLFRSTLAQNERSLFAFLAGQEPHGFQEFLSSVSWEHGQPPFYRIDHLYDYITVALGAAIYAGDRARRWAEIAFAIDRVPANAPGLAQAVVKAVGLVGLYGQTVGLHASDELLHLALGNPAGVAEALEFLKRASILVYRRHEHAYGLWEGSDVDLEAHLEEAHRQAGYGGLATRLKAVVNLRPVVARAHYIEKGTLRYFAVDIIDGNEQALRSALEEPSAPADGKVLYVLTPNPRGRKTLIATAQSLTGSSTPAGRLQILAFPQPMIGLSEALLEVESWKWIRENVQALQGDPVARKEVSARIGHAQEKLERLAGHVFGFGGQLFDPMVSEWVQGGKVHALRSGKEFLQWLSRLSDEVFDQSPTLCNELLNRDKLSSAAAKARRNLLEAMTKNERDPNLGFSGTPPEVSMYRSLLVEGGFHSEHNGQWHFGRPGQAWQPLWNAIDNFLNTTHRGRRPVLELYNILKQPPFGLRDGPLPVLLCAVLLAHRDEVALYEEGLFVPELRIEILERLLRVPQAFEVQEYAFDNYHRRAFAAVNEVIHALQLTRDQSTSPELVEIVRSLVVFARRLPAYARNTKRVEPPQAIEVRDALLKARDPHALMFAELPAVMGIESIDDKELAEFTRVLKDCILGLLRAYPRLLDEIEAQLCQVFGLQGPSASVREQLRTRAALLEEYAADRTLTLFVREACHLGSSSDWREALGRAVNGGMPPHQWHDADAVSFPVRLQLIKSDFVKLEELAAEQRRTGTRQVLRIGLLDGRAQEALAVIAMDPERVPAVQSLADRITSLIEENVDGSEESQHVRLAALARVLAQFLRRDEGD